VKDLSNVMKVAAIRALHKKLILTSILLFISEEKDKSVQCAAKYLHPHTF
jgi:hypothetical protein